MIVSLLSKPRLARNALSCRHSYLLVPDMLDGGSPIGSGSRSCGDITSR